MPIQLIWGDDSASSNRAIELFINEIVDPLWNTLNLSRLDGSELEQSKQALNEARTPPFGNGGRIVLLKRSPICNNCPSELSELFLEMIDLIPTNTYLILNNSIKPDKRLKSTKALESLIREKKAIERFFILPTMWDIRGQKEFINRTANELGLKVSPDAILRLIEAIGNDSSRLYSELEKLAIFSQGEIKSKGDKAEQKTITAKTVNQLIEGVTTNSLQIGNELIKGNLGEAISLIDSLLNSGEPALRILATLTGQVRGCLWVKLLEMEGETDVQKIAKAGGIGNPKRIYIMRKQIHGKTPPYFLKLLNKLLKIEADLKHGALPKEAFRDGLLTDN